MLDYPNLIIEAVEYLWFMNMCTLIVSSIIAIKTYNFLAWFKAGIDGQSINWLPHNGVFNKPWFRDYQFLSIYLYVNNQSDSAS